MQTVAQKVYGYLPEVVVRCSINNQITLGLQQVTRTQRPRYDSISRINLPDDTAEYYKSGQAAYDRAQDARYDRKSVIMANVLGEPVRKWLKTEKPSPSTLDLIKKSQRSLNGGAAGVGFRAKRVSKPKKFGTRQGHRIREAGAAVDIVCNGDSSLARVVTLTLPGDTHEAKQAIARRSGYVINRLFQSNRHNYAECNNWFFVWEYQKRGALHLHICLYHNDREVSKEIGDRMIKDWHQIMIDVGELENCCMFTSRQKDRCTIRDLHQNLNQEMIKSCGGYFSKYASKGENGKEREKLEKWSQIYSPSRFWGSSQSIKELVKEHSFSFNLEMLNGSEAMEVYEFCLNLLTDRTLSHYTEHEFKLETESQYGNRTIAEGFRQNFYVSPKDYQEILAMLRQCCKAFTVEDLRPQYCKIG